MARLAHPQHTAKLRPHIHTSYHGLAAILMLTGLLLAGVSQNVNAASGLPPELQVAQNPVQGAIGVSATVAGPPPSTGAVIITPRTGSTTSGNPITVNGTCPAGLLVSLYKNDVFAGSTVCTAQGAFTLVADLFDGANTLVAKVTDALNQSGPDSAGINVFYNAPSLALPGSVALGRQLFLQTNTPSRGAQPDQAMNWEATIVGGTGPYAISWDWGDNTTTLLSRQFEGSFTSSHTYKRAGNYRVVLKVTDSLGNSAYMQLVSVVNGPIEAVTSSSAGITPGTLVRIWPLYGLACLFVLVFWLGERRELHKLGKRGQLLPAA